MPRMPRQEHCDCCRPTNASEDIKLKIMEKKIKEDLSKEFVNINNLKTVNNESLIGEGNITLSTKMTGYNFESNIPVGGVPAGTAITDDTDMKDIFHQMLYAEKVRHLLSIQVVQMPNKVVYALGDFFDPAGMQIKATYDTGETELITSYTYTPTTALILADTEVTIKYSEGTTEVSTKINITVKDTSKVAIKYGVSGVYAEGTTYYPNDIDSEYQVNYLADDIAHMNSEELPISTLLSENGYAFKAVTIKRTLPSEDELGKAEGQYASILLPKGYKVVAFKNELGVSPDFGSCILAEGNLYWYKQTYIANNKSMNFVVEVEEE